MKYTLQNFSSPVLKGPHKSIQAHFSKAINLKDTDAGHIIPSALGGAILRGMYDDEPYFIGHPQKAHVNRFIWKNVEKFEMSYAKENCPLTVKKYFHTNYWSVVFFKDKKKPIKIICPYYKNEYDNVIYTDNIKLFVFYNKSNKYTAKKIPDSLMKKLKETNMRKLYPRESDDLASDEPLTDETKEEEEGLSPTTDADESEDE